MHTKTHSIQVKKTAIAALMSALGVVIMYIGAVVSVLDLTALAVSSLLIYVVVIELGGPYPWLTWLVTGLLGVLILPCKECATMYILLGGAYPIFKSMFERLHPVVSWILKFSFFNTSLLLIITVITYILHIPDSKFQFGWLVFAVSNAVFLLYDIAATKLVTLYIVKLRKMLHLSDIF